MIVLIFDCCLGMKINRREMRMWAGVGLTISLLVGPRTRFLQSSGQQITDSAWEWLVGVELPKWPRTSRSLNIKSQKQSNTQNLCPSSPSEIPVTPFPSFCPTYKDILEILFTSQKLWPCGRVIFFWLRSYAVSLQITGKGKN